MEQSDSLRIAIQKSGRLTEKTMNLLEGIGLRFDDYKRSLMVKCLNLNVELLLIRDDDIPEYVQDGVCHLGFVGANVIQEDNADVTVLKNLDYGHCRLSLAAPKNGILRSYKDFDGKKIATSYPFLSQKWFDEKGLSVNIIHISGAVEITPTLNVADAIVDLVSTGTTLRANGLVELDTILKSQTQIIQTNKPLTDEHKQLIDRLILRIKGRQTAVRSRYIMMNAPTESLDLIKEVLPAAKSPTVLPLADSKMIAIHSVVPINQFWEITESLKKVGASDIVILPIESIIE